MLLSPNRPSLPFSPASTGAESLTRVSPWLVVLGTVISLITIFALQHTNDWDVEGYIVCSLLHGMVYLIAVWKVWTHQSRPADFAWIVIFALVFRALSMMSEPALSTDAFRYVWDGRIQAAGVNPYVHVPADPALEAYRDSDIYPHINKKDVAHTIYPPMAQITFLVGASLGLGLEGMKIIGLLFEGIIIAALVHWLGLKRLPVTLVLIYAWHPLPIWEFTSQAHIDSAATALMVLAIVAAQKQRQGWAGVALSAAVLVKYFPIAIFPAIWKRWDWRMPTAMLACATVLYLPYVLTADAPVSGFLSKHLDAEGYGEGWGFHPVWFARLMGLGTVSGQTYLAGAMAILAALAGWSFFRRERSELKPEALMLLGGGFAFLSSPHYPWYLGFLVPLLVMCPSVPVFLMTVFCTVLQVTRSTDGFSWTQPFLLTYLIPAAAWMSMMAWRRWRQNEGIAIPAIDENISQPVAQTTSFALAENSVPEPLLVVSAADLTSDSEMGEVVKA